VGGWPASFGRRADGGVEGHALASWRVVAHGDPAHSSEEPTCSRQIAINYRNANITERQKAATSRLRIAVPKPPRGCRLKFCRRAPKLW
jgi:hypothetical protein